MKQRITRYLGLAVCCSALFFSAVPASAAAQPKISKKQLTLQEGDSKKLSIKKSGAKKIKSTKWSSTNKNCASVSKSGLVIAKKSGQTVIKAKVSYLAAKSKKVKKCTLSCKVTVKGLDEQGQTTTTVSPTQAPSTTTAPVQTQAPVMQVTVPPAATEAPHNTNSAIVKEDVMKLYTNDDKIQLDKVTSSSSQVDNDNIKISGADIYVDGNFGPMSELDETFQVSFTNPNVSWTIQYVNEAYYSSDNRVGYYWIHAELRENDVVYYRHYYIHRSQEDKLGIKVKGRITFNGVPYSGSVWLSSNDYWSNSTYVETDENGYYECSLRKGSYTPTIYGYSSSGYYMSSEYISSDQDLNITGANNNLQTAIVNDKYGILHVSAKINGVNWSRKRCTVYNTAGSSKYLYLDENGTGSLVLEKDEYTVKASRRGTDLKMEQSVKVSETENNVLLEENSDNYCVVYGNLEGKGYLKACSLDSDGDVVKTYSISKRHNRYFAVLPKGKYEFYTYSYGRNRLFDYKIAEVSLDSEKAVEKDFSEKDVFKVLDIRLNCNGQDPANIKRIYVRRKDDSLMTYFELDNYDSAGNYLYGDFCEVPNGVYEFGILVRQDDGLERMFSISKDYEITRDQRIVLDASQATVDEGNY